MGGAEGIPRLCPGAAADSCDEDREALRSRHSAAEFEIDACSCDSFVFKEMSPE